MKQHRQIYRNRFVSRFLLPSFPVFLFFFLCLPSTGFGSWQAVSLEAVLEQSDAVVVGTMTNVDTVEGTGTIDVSRVLSGDQETFGGTIPARFSAIQPSRPRHSAQITFENGDRGIWICGPKTKGDRYKFHNHPSQVLSPDQVQTVQKKLQKLRNRSWNTDPDTGLSISVTLFRMGIDRKKNRQRFFVTLRNDAEHPLLVMNNPSTCYPIDCAVENTPDRMRRCNVPKPCAQKEKQQNGTFLKRDRDLIKLAPGEKSILGEHGSFTFSTSGLKQKKGTEAPVLRVRYTFPYELDQQPENTPIFQGSLKAPATEIDVP